MQRWQNYLQLFLVCCLCSSLMGFHIAAKPNQSLPIQPLLLQLATQQPDQRVGVIVQTWKNDQGVEAFVTQLGGQITSELPIIHAFAAELPGRAVLNLAHLSNVRWVSWDAPITKSAGPDGTVDASTLLNVYDKAIGADSLWAMGYQGSSVTVAIVDSGWTNHEDFRATPSGGAMRLLTRVGFNGNETNLDDHYGHSTHIAGIIGGNGRISKGQYIGIAPKVNLVSVKVSDGVGQGTASGVIAGLQWIFQNKTQYNIRVVNISLNSIAAESYHTNPIDAAAEVLWFNGIVVVVSAGNTGSNALYPPANDPFVITVGAVDDRGTVSVKDDLLASYSAYGKTIDGFSKPDFVAPGSNLIAPLASGGADLPQAHPANRVDGKTDYFRMSGTSMAAAVTSGAVALLLQDEPTLTPDQVKYRLQATARPFDTTLRAGKGYLNIAAAAASSTTNKANQNIPISRLLWTNNQQLLWNTLTEGSVGWGAKGSDFWSSVVQNSALNNSVTWGSDYWDPVVSASAVDGLPALQAGDAIDATTSPTDAVGNQRIFLPFVSR